MPHPMLVAALVGLLAVMGCSSDPTPGDPVAVAPADDDRTGDSRDPGDRTQQLARETERPPWRHGAGETGSLWVVDLLGVEAGVLVRRGSDDNIASRAIYDIVTVFHPDSGLFYELTMSDGVVRYPGTTFFEGSWCGDPVGVGVGGCDTCRAGFGIGILHDGAWWTVVGGAEYEQATAGSSRDAGVDAECTAHSTFNAKVFPVLAVEGATPPTILTPPLRFEWR